MTVTMREGAYYERRDGRVVGPVIKWFKSRDYPWRIDKCNYTNEGRVIFESTHDFDLIREVPNPNMKEREMLLTETVTTTRIKEVIDGNGPGGARVSVVSGDASMCRIVIGALYQDACACAFSRESLTELIAELTAVRDALEE